MSETYISDRDILTRIKLYKQANNDDFKFETGIMNLTDKGRERINKPVNRNQDRKKPPIKGA
jgi:hypothetical protein